MESVLYEIIADWRSTWGTQPDSNSQTYWYNYLKDSSVDVSNKTFAQVIAQYAFNNDDRNFATNLNLIILNYNDTISICPLIDSIKQWESTVLIASLDSATKMHLLSTGSIARYSAYYWWNQIIVLGSSSKWNYTCSQGLRIRQTGKHSTSKLLEKDNRNFNATLGSMSADYKAAYANDGPETSPISASSPSAWNWEVIIASSQAYMRIITGPYFQP